MAIGSLAFKGLFQIASFHTLADIALECSLSFWVRELSIFVDLEVSGACSC